jgi:hypothetical protein
MARYPLPPRILITVGVPLYRRILPKIHAN